MSVGVLPDRPPRRDHTLVAIYRLLAMDEQGQSLASACDETGGRGGVREV
mgnify:CR=1 FL=1